MHAGRSAAVSRAAGYRTAAATDAKPDGSEDARESPFPRARDIIEDLVADTNSGLDRYAENAVGPNGL